ncbi:ABC transporter permease [Mesorhizobium sp. M6A.T.Cr.TU.014.01.1.1]|uniref:ABC transporter permease n=2 Tax=Mesorhizobium TaxID=68287 RepID=UPI000FD25CEA|nr:ABC transporter permease [Mesorhizobium sp.]RVB80550.1 ABC transporter permease [Mesorhizobium sp. M6A.T.Cr.TU.014.01.1.1]RWQ10653.1 MAG: ABC transporter permease [Mesorhizobium sp.]RWQ10864.1 MAG: ABC transporter permease [Mesorhizobium sp.]
MRSVWMALAHEDIGDHHKRTALGPIWLLINYLAFAGTFVVIFGDNQSVPHFAAYVATGLFVWLYLTEVTTQSVTLFNREESFIKGTTLPLTVYILRMTMQSVIRAGYALIGCLAILLLVGTPVTVGWLWSGLALIMIVVATPAAILVLAVAGAFFPDLSFIVQNLMRIGMFITPIFWMRPDGGVRGELYRWNPFTYFLEIVRLPVINTEFPVAAFGICATIILFLWVLAALLLGGYRKKIVFML